MTDEIVTDTAPAASEGTPAPEPTLREILENQYAKIEARDAMPDRGEGGRFVSKNPPDAAPVEATPAAETTVEPTPKASEQVKPASAPPDAWTAEQKAKWTELSPEWQAFLAEREKSVNDALSQKGQELKRYEPWQRVVEPHRERLAQLGVSEAEYAARLFAVDAALANPATRDRTIRQIAQMYGVSLDQPQADHSGQSAQPQDPVVAALTSKVQQLEALIANEQQRQVAAAGREAEAKAQAFLNDPKYPFAKEVESDMAVLIMAERQLGRELTLEQAYQKAVRANDTVWSKIEAEKKAKAEADAKAEAEKKAAEARKKAPTVIKPRGSGATAPAGKANMRATMEAVYDRLNGAA